MLFRNIILTTALLLSAGIAGAAELLSPDGNVKLTFDLTTQGEPMEYVTVARKAKNSDDWFVGCSNGIEPRVSEIDFFIFAGRPKISGHNLPRRQERPLSQCPSGLCHRDKDRHVEV